MRCFQQRRGCEAAPRCDAAAGSRAVSGQRREPSGLAAFRSIRIASNTFSTLLPPESRCICAQWWRVAAGESALTAVSAPGPQGVTDAALRPMFFEDRAAAVLG